MDKPKFTMMDDGFICEVCKKEVKSLEYSARNHCPYCLSSKHVDNNPGDRESICHGILNPIGIEKSKKSDYKIIFKCDKCGEYKKNIMALDDNMDLIIELSSSPNVNANIFNSQSKNF
ncbi:MAG: RNHCP domain-containing protein [Bacilli bacterium]|nr:RNHCP domain-containing protein [Bacilli bacterium]